MNRRPSLASVLILAMAFLQVAHAESGRAVPAAAAQPSVAEREIGYLLGFVGQSGCEFYRNGRWHDARSAQGHLRKKYEYLAARKRVNTAEDFIVNAATKSSLSSLAYAVRCSGGESVPTSHWLQEALAVYRTCGIHNEKCASRIPRDAQEVNDPG